MPKKVLTEADVAQVPPDSKIHIPPDTIVTPSARDLAGERRIEICQVTSKQRETIAIAADHAGFALKEKLKALLMEQGYDFHDFGTFDETPVDYPDVAYQVAAGVSSGMFARGIIIDGAGIGSCIVANKLPGVRAAMCYDAATARNSREHNDANVLTLGARVLKEQTVREIVSIWLSSRITEEHHQRRIEKIKDLERKHMKNP